MPAVQFDPTALAKWYAVQHLKTDPGIRLVYYLPTNAAEREIRLVEVNDLVVERNGRLEPIDFGIDFGMDSEHTLFVLDVTPQQWDQIVRSELALPPGWSLENAKSFGPDCHE